MYNKYDESRVPVICTHNFSLIPHLFIDLKLGKFNFYGAKLLE